MCAKAPPRPGASPHWLTIALVITSLSLTVWGSAARSLNKENSEAVPWHSVSVCPRRCRS